MAVGATEKHRIMSLRESFASNLSRLCARQPSIAAVCRGTEINRQQFSRYLSGAALPNGRNLDKICRYFDIDEADLFRRLNGAESKTGRTDEPSSRFHADLRTALDLIRSEGPTSVAAGYYFAHFAHPHDPASIMRSVLVVRRDGNLSTFRRLTGRFEKRGSWWSHFHGDHKGIILERRHWLYFVALNSVGNNEPTLLVLRWVPSSDPILGGHASILTPIGPTVTAVVITPCPSGTTLRAAINESHVHSVDSATIDPIILDALEQQCQALIGMVRHLDLGVRPVASDAHQL